MNPAFTREIDLLYHEPVAPGWLKCAAPLETASSLLSSAAAHEMSATTVVGVLGCDDADAFRSLVAAISAEYGLEATVKLQSGAYAVRFSRSAMPLVH